jgi:hypothetical protein
MCLNKTDIEYMRKSDGTQGDCGVKKVQETVKRQQVGLYGLDD